MTILRQRALVQDSRLEHGVLQAYHTLLMVGRYPLCILRVELNPEDVERERASPKTEVRFRNNDAIFRVVQRAVRTHPDRSRARFHSAGRRRPSRRGQAALRFAR